MTVIHIDGASRGNPGPAGIGVVLRREGEEPLELSEAIGTATNNQAGYRALVRALELALELGCPQVHVYSDSELLVRQMRGEYRVRHGELRPLFEQASALARQLEVRFSSVPREANRQADQLARRGADAASGRTPQRRTRPDDDLEPKEAMQRSAGGVVYRKDGGGFKVCLIAKRGGNVWALPKGRLNPGETPEQTARREVLEETGHLAEVGEKIDEIDYFFYWKENRTLYHKVVTFYLMPLVQECAAPRDDEAEDVAWFTMGEAWRRLSYLNEKEVLRQAQRILRTAGA